MPKPVRLLTPREVVAFIGSLDIEELTELNERTAQTRGDADYIVKVSEWKKEGRKINEQTHRRRGQTKAR